MPVSIIVAVGQTIWREGSSAVQEWLRAQLHALKHKGPDAVLTAVAQLATTKHLGWGCKPRRQAL